MRNSSIFHFKQFSVSQDKSIHKVGTDGVLLGAWVDCRQVTRVLDAGTGTGVIALMIAQRTDPAVLVDAVDLEEQDVRQAESNFQASPWNGRLRAFHSRLQDFEPGYQYDLVVTNPPFFSNSQKPPSGKRSQARHTDTLPYSDVIHAATRLLNRNGRLAIILPLNEGNDFSRLAVSAGLHCRRKCTFQSRRHKPVERLLQEFHRDPAETCVEHLILYEDRSNATDAYRALTTDFYLNF